MLEDRRLLTLVLHGLDVLPQLFVLPLEAFDLLFAHRFLLVELLVVTLVLHRGVFFEASPLILQLVHLLSQAVSVHAVSFPLFLSVRQLSAQVRDLIVLLLNQGLMLLPESLRDPLVPLLTLRGFLLELVFESSHLGQVLLLLEKHPVALQVRIFDSLLALVGKTVD